MSDDTMATQTLIERLIEAEREGLLVTARFAGIKSAYRVKNPQISDGILSFEDTNGRTVRVLNSAVVAITEEEDFD